MLHSAPSSRSRWAPPSLTPDDHLRVQLHLAQQLAPRRRLVGPVEHGVEVVGEGDVEHHVGRMAPALGGDVATIVRPT